MSKPPRKHHFVQAEHIRQFVNSDGILRAYGKDGTRFHGSPEGLFKKRDLNSFDGADGLDTSFEGYVTEIENECWPALRRTIESRSINPEDVEAIAGYLALSRVRNPTVQAGILEFNRQVVEKTAVIMDQHGAFDEIGPNPIDPKRSLSELLTDGTLEVRINNSEYLRAIVDMVEPFQRILAGGFRWSLVFSPHDRVLISDHPLTYLHPGEGTSAYGIVPGGTSCEMAFPLSKDTYLLGLWERKVEDVESEDIVDELNKRQAIFASRHIASSYPHRKWARLIQRFKDYGFQTLAQNIGPYHMLRAGVYGLPNTKPNRAKDPLLQTRSVTRLLRA